MVDNRTHVDTALRIKIIQNNTLKFGTTDARQAVCVYICVCVYVCVCVCVFLSQWR